MPWPTSPLSFSLSFLSPQPEQSINVHKHAPIQNNEMKVRSTHTTVWRLYYQATLYYGFIPVLAILACPSFFYFRKATITKTNKRTKNKEETSPPCQDITRETHWRWPRSKYILKEKYPCKHRQTACPNQSKKNRNDLAQCHVARLSCKTDRFTRRQHMEKTRGFECCQGKGLFLPIPLVCPWFDVCMHSTVVAGKLF